MVAPGNWATGYVKPWGCNANFVLMDQIIFVLGCSYAKLGVYIKIRVIITAVL